MRLTFEACHQNALLFLLLWTRPVIFQIIDKEPSAAQYEDFGVTFNTAFKFRTHTLIVQKHINAMRSYKTPSFIWTVYSIKMVSLLTSMVLIS